MKEYRTNYGDLMKEQTKQWHKQHPGYICKWRKRNRVRYNLQQRNWRSKNRKKWRVYMRNYMRRYRGNRKEHQRISGK